MTALQELVLTGDVETTQYQVIILKQLTKFTDCKGKRQKSCLQTYGTKFPLTVCTPHRYKTLITIINDLI